jgi:hypothetical protein
VGGLTCVEQLSIGAFPPSTTRSAICGRLPTAWAVRSSWVYKDHGISGTKGRDRRPAFDKLCRDAARREFTESLGACERPFHRLTTLHAREISTADFVLVKLRALQ